MFNKNDYKPSVLKYNPDMDNVKVIFKCNFFFYREYTIRIQTIIIDEDVL